MCYCSFKILLKILLNLNLLILFSFLYRPMQFLLPKCNYLVECNSDIVLCLLFFQHCQIYYLIFFFSSVLQHRKPILLQNSNDKNFIIFFRYLIKLILSNISLNIQRKKLKLLKKFTVNLLKKLFLHICFSDVIYLHYSFNFF